MFALTYAGHFNSAHICEMPSGTRRWHLKRLHQQKLHEEESLKEARAKAKLKHKKPRR